MSSTNTLSEDFYNIENWFVFSTVWNKIKVDFIYFFCTFKQYKSEQNKKKTDLASLHSRPTILFFCIFFLFRSRLYWQVSKTSIDHLNIFCPISIIIHTLKDICNKNVVYDCNLYWNKMKIFAPYKIIQDGWFLS